MITFKLKTYSNQEVIKNTRNLISRTLTHLYVIAGDIHPKSDKHHLGEVKNWTKCIASVLWKDKTAHPERIEKLLEGLLWNPSQQWEREVGSGIIEDLRAELEIDYGFRDPMIDRKTLEESVRILSQILKYRYKKTKEYEDMVDKEYNKWLKDLKK